MSGREMKALPARPSTGTPTCPATTSAASEGIGRAAHVQWPVLNEHGSRRLGETIESRFGKSRFVSPLLPAAPVRFGASGRLGSSLPAPSRGIGGDRRTVSRRAPVLLGLTGRCGFIGSRKGALGNETLFSDSFSVRARRSGGGLVDVCGRTLDVRGCLQHLGIFQCGVLGVIEVAQYEWVRREL